MTTNLPPTECGNFNLEEVLLDSVSGIIYWGYYIVKH